MTGVTRNRHRFPFHPSVAVVSTMALLLVAGIARAGDDGRVIRGVDAVDEPLPWFDDERRYPAWSGDILGMKPDQTVAVTSTGRPPMDGSVELMLSRYRYPAEDRHLDAIVRFDMDIDEQPQGRLHVSLHDAAGDTLSEDVIDPIPGAQLHFSYRLPEELNGGEGALRVVWERDGEPEADGEAPFRVAEPVEVERSGRVRIDVPNHSGAHLDNAPVTAGVPFPRGVLDDTDHLRLVDDDGREVPLQVKRTARWSRIGSIRWVLCDFTADVDGQGATFWLEYGPDVTRADGDAIQVTLDDEGGFPHVDAGRLRIDDDGVAWDVDGEGGFRQVLEREALTGAFVEHMRGVTTTDWMMSSGTIYDMPSDPAYTIEEIGPEKVVIRAEGWYTHAESDEDFCKFVTRYVIHRDAPVVRIFHTWIFTGDGNRDTIRDFGWRFTLGEGMEPTGFLSGFGDDAAWLEGYYQRQHDADEWALFEHNARGPLGRHADYMTHHKPIDEIATGHRAPGVVAAERNGVRVHLGVKDFWQNFPRSLRIEDDAVTFYEWPRYGRRPQPEHQPDSENVGEAWRLWFAHEGDVLSFRLPTVLTVTPFHFAAARAEPHVDYGRPDSVNAQGVAKTAEKWLYFTPADTPADEANESDENEAVEAVEAAKVHQGLAEETLRGVVDPSWLASSGAFYEVGTVDAERWPHYAEAYQRHVRHLLHKVERMSIYGKWLYGEMVSGPNLDETTGGLYRFLRKGHHGWPFSWLPFATTGDTEALRMAEAATRMMSDVAFCHYVSDDVAQQFAEMPKRRIWMENQPFRAIGWHNRNMIPWAGYQGPTTRCYVDQADYLWHAYYLTGYTRARDVAMTWAEQTKIEAPREIGKEKWGRGPITAAGNRARWASNLQKQYLEMYENTDDPWFLAATHAIAEMRLWQHREGESVGWRAWSWGGGLTAFQRFTGSPEFAELYMDFVDHWADWHHQGWHGANSVVRPIAYAYHKTGDDYYKRRAAGLMDMATWALYSGEEPWYYEGFFLAQGRSTLRTVFDSWMQWLGPRSFGTFGPDGPPPGDPIPPAFNTAIADTARIAVRKESDQPLTLRTSGRDYRIIGPDGETVLEGDEDEVTLDSDLPAGTYYFDPGGSSVTWPISPPDVPEVIVDIERDSMRASGSQRAQFWFYVPEGVESFWVEFDNVEHFRQRMRQNIIWNPDGREVWAHRQLAADRDPDVETIRAEIEVDPEHTGRLWRVTKPGYWSAGGRRTDEVRFDPQIPPVLTHSPDRWFDPDFVR